MAHFAQGADPYLDHAYSLEKGHGRIDERRMVTSFRLAGCLEFPYLEQVFRLERRSEEVKSGKVSEQIMYGMTSWSVAVAGAQELLAATRALLHQDWTWLLCLLPNTKFNLEKTLHNVS